MPNVRIRRSSVFVCSVIKADLSIGAAGITSWERFASLPAVVIPVAKNQECGAYELIIGAAISLEADPTEIVGKIRSTLLALLASSIFERDVNFRNTSW